MGQLKGQLPPLFRLERVSRQGTAVSSARAPLVSGKRSIPNFANSASITALASAELMQTPSSTICSRPSLFNRHSWRLDANWPLPRRGPGNHRVTRYVCSRGAGCSASLYGKAVRDSSPFCACSAPPSGPLRAWVG
jgi:hypothetical protein